MAKGKIVCNICGNTFEEWDEYAELGVHKRLDYGSKYDGSLVDLDLCCECFDTAFDEFRENAKLIRS